MKDFFAIFSFSTEPRIFSTLCQLSSEVGSCANILGQSEGESVQKMVCAIHGLDSQLVDGSLRLCVYRVVREYGLIDLRKQMATDKIRLTRNQL